MKSNGNIVISKEERETKIKTLTHLYRKIFDVLGFQWKEDQNMVESPKRIAKMYVNELLSGNFTEEPKMTVFSNLNTNNETQKTNSMVVLGPIRVHSLCSHHFLPFIGSAYVGYIPGDYVVGISKLARVVNWFSKRPQIQEELGEQIADFIDDKLKPEGVGVFIKAQHGCMQIRGIAEPESFMTTMALRNIFYNESIKNEFISYIK